MMSPVFAALMAAGLVSMGGFWFYHSIARSGTDVTRRTQTSAIFDQSAYALSAESVDADADGYRESPAFTVNASFAPSGGGIIPASSMAPKLDGWGRQIGYCPFDNGTTSGGNLIAGDSPGTTASVAFALVTAGANGQFETSCAQAKAGTVMGDDGVRLITETTQKQLAGGLTIGTGAYWKSAVANTAALPAGSVVGEVRVTLDNGAINQWNGSVWSAAVASGGGGGATMWAGAVNDRSSLGACTTDGNVLYSLADYFFWKCSAPAGLAWQAEDLPSSAGTLWSWGYNGYGQLGLGDTTARSSPVQVGGLANWKEVDGGNGHTVAIKSDGTLWTWGQNYGGWLCLGDTTDRSSPVQVGVLTNWKQVAGGRLQTIALKTDGTLWTCGMNVWGELGLNDTVSRSSPVQVGALTTWKQIDAGFYHSVAIKTDGTLWAWGRNIYGLLGLNDTVNRSSPVQVGTLTDWKQVTGALFTTYGTKTDGTLWAWGAGSFGSLGLGDTTDHSSPVQIGALTNWKQMGIRSSDTSTASAVKTDGSLWAWGFNNYGQMGNGSTTGSLSPVQIGALTNWKQATSSVSHSLAIKTDGTLWAWGRNNYGQLGQGNTTNSSSPVQVGTLTNWKQVTTGNRYSFAIQSDNPSNAIVGSPTAPEQVWAGTLWTWGNNPYGQLGDGTITDKSSPVQVGALSNWTSAGIAYSTLATKTDGTLWAWGYNASGQLGLSNTTYYSSPMQVGALTNWKSISDGSGVRNSLAVKMDGTLWAWGMNFWGPLGIGNITDSASPVQVGALTNWEQAIVTDQSVMTIKNDGTLWAWGYNGYGQLGTGNITNYSSPVQVGALNNWAQGSLSNSIAAAVKTDGTLWTWGRNNYGALGVGDNTNRSSPTQVAGTNWKQVTTGYWFCAAVKTDGTLWTWGNNSYGKLAQGNSGAGTHVSSPVQVGTLSNWKQVSAKSAKYALAVRTDGTLWAWGRNDTGQLGQGNTTNYSSPVQVGGLTNWYRTATGFQQSLGIQKITCLEYCY